MTKLTQTVRRAADISRADALKGLVAKFPDHDIDSMRLEIVEHKTASGEVTSTSKQWVAEIHKSGFEEMESGPAGPGTVAAEEDPDDPTPEEKPAEEPEADVEIAVDDAPEDKGASEKDLLQQLVDLVSELVGEPAGEGAPHGEGGPEGLPQSVPGDPGLSDVPAPVKPHNTMDNQLQGPRPAFAHMANRRHFIVEADAPGQSLKSAVKELNAALAPTHRVAKIQRKGAKIVAGVTRVPGV